MSKVILVSLGVLTIAAEFAMRLAIIIFACFIILLFGHGVYEQTAEIWKGFQTKRMLKRRAAVAA
jgi:hypothetical protein